MLDSAAKIVSLKNDWPENIALKCFDPEWFETLDGAEQSAFMDCLASGIANPDSQMGCYANRVDDYDRFQPFFSKVVARYHGVDDTAQHKSSWDVGGKRLDVNSHGIAPLSIRVRVGRNLNGFPLPAAMDRADRLSLEAQMQIVFDRLTRELCPGGTYHSLTPGHENESSAEQYSLLVKQHLMFKDMSVDRFLVSAGIASDWPYGRGCYISGDQQLIIWLGEEDHLRIMVMQNGTALNEPFDRLKADLDWLENSQGLMFATSTRFGAITSCPTNLGTGMRASVHLKLPHLTQGGSDKRVKEITGPLGLSVRGLGGEHTPIGEDGTVDVSPSARFCITEAEILEQLYVGVLALHDAETTL